MGVYVQVNTLDFNTCKWLSGSRVSLASVSKWSASNCKGLQVDCKCVFTVYIPKQMATLKNARVVALASGQQVAASGLQIPFQGLYYKRKYKHQHVDHQMCPKL